MFLHAFLDTLSNPTVAMSNDIALLGFLYPVIIRIHLASANEALPSKGY